MEKATIILLACSAGRILVLWKWKGRSWDDK